MKAISFVFSKTHKRMYFSLVCLGVLTSSFGQPYFLPGQDPKPTNKVWKLVDSMSDEFDQATVNTSKWQTNPVGNGWTWIGRAPGLFDASSVSIVDGKLCVTVKQLDKAQTINGNTFLYQGAIVRSISAGQHGWYYECKMKANSTTMSSTFWLMSKNSDCLKKLELDIQECVGRTTDLTETWAKTWNKIFHSNAIHRTTNCVATAVQKQGSIATEVENNARYFVYAAWWKSPTEIQFFLDGKYVYSITPSTNFDMPAWIQMAIEVYDWNPVPSDGGLVKSGTWDERTTQYDWVRTWQLVDDVNASVVVKQDSRQDVTVYPNPFKESCKVGLPQGHRYKVFKLMDSLGQMVYSQPIAPTQDEISITPNVRPGIYYLSLYGDTSYLPIKLVKQ